MNKGVHVGDTAVESKRFPTSVKVVHDGLNYEIDVDAEIGIDPQNLKEAFTSQAGQYSWYATVHAAALHYVEVTKRKLDLVKSQVAGEWRGRVTEKGKPYSETAIASMSDSDKRVEGAHQDLLEAKRQEGILRAVREAFAHRRDMLIQLGANERLEKSTY